MGKGFSTGGWVSPESRDRQGEVPAVMQIHRIVVLLRELFRQNPFPRIDLEPLLLHLPAVNPTVPQSRERLVRDLQELFSHRL